MTKECQTLFFNSVNFELFSCCNGTKVTEVYCIESVPLPQHFMIACVFMLLRLNDFATNFGSELSYVVYGIRIKYCYILYTVQYVSYRYPTAVPRIKHRVIHILFLMLQLLLCLWLVAAIHHTFPPPPYSISVCHQARKQKLI